MATPLPLPSHTPSSLHPVPSYALTVPSLLPSPSAPPPKRADVVSLKLRLAGLLSPARGELYWTALGEFVLGRITRGELDEAMGRAFKGNHRGEAVKLHNALLLSILYNTTRPHLPPSSIRHSGFLPRGARKRSSGTGGDDDGADDPASDKRRRLVKMRVMALGRRERGEVKLLGSASASGEGGKKPSRSGADDDEQRRKQRREQGRISEAVGGTSRGGARGEVGEAGVGAEGLPRALREREADGAALPPNLAQEYRRLVQLPMCCESRVLPDTDTLHDRMTALTYEEGLPDGVEGRAAGLVQGAIEHHLKGMIASVISLVRGTRQAVPSRGSSSVANSAASTPQPSTSSTFAPAGAAPSAPSPASTPTPAADALDLDALDLDASPPPPAAPLTVADFHALFAISPSLLGQHPHVGAVERMYAIPPPESDSSSDEDDEEEREAHAQARTAAQQAAVEAKDDAEGDTKMLDAPPPNAAKPLNPAVAALAGAAATPAPGTGAGAGKMPRLSRARGSSFYGAVRPVFTSSTVDAASSGGGDADAGLGFSLGGAGSAAGEGKGKGKGRFVLDPSSLHGVPEGHPDVPPLVFTPAPAAASAAGGSTAAGSATPAGPGPADAAAAAAGGGGAPGQLSPKSLSLRNSLFPELAAASASASAGGPSGAAAALDGNGTTTDAGESDSDDDAPAKAGAAQGGAGGSGLKIKLGASTSGTSGPAGQRPSLSAPTAGAAGALKPTTNERDRAAGRKLWEVVDSVGLLDGVLPP